MNYSTKIRISCSEFDKDGYTSIQQAIWAQPEDMEATVFVEEGNFEEDLILRNNCNIWLGPNVILLGYHSDKTAQVNVVFSGNGTLYTNRTDNTLFEILCPTTKIIVNCNMALGELVKDNDTNFKITTNEGSSLDISRTKSITTIDTNYYLGARNNANGNFNIISGNGASISGDSSAALGQNQSITGFANILAGYSSKVIGDYNIEAGSGNNTVGNYSLVAGAGNNIGDPDFPNNKLENNIVAGYTNNVTNGDSNIQAGRNNTLSGDANLMVCGNGNLLGNYNNASGSANGVFGNFNLAAGERNISYGDGNQIAGHFHFIGNFVESSNYNSVFGEENSVWLDSNIVGGGSNSVSGYSNFACGFDNTILGNDTLIAGNTNGSTGNWNVLGGQSNTTLGDNNVQVGNNNALTGDNNSQAGNANSLNGEGAGQVGSNNISSGDSNYQAGNSNSVNGDQNAQAGGSNFIVNGNANCQYGNSNSITSSNNIQTGTANILNGSYNAQFGALHVITGDSNAQFGDGHTTNNNLSLQIGRSSSAGHVASFVHSSGSFSATKGQSQTMNFVISATAFDSSGAVLKNGFRTENADLTIPNNTVWAYSAQVTAIDTSGASVGTVGSWFVRGTIKNISGTVSDVGTQNKIFAGEAPFDAGHITVVANNTTKSLEINAAGVDDEIIRYSANVLIQQCSY